MYDTFLINMTPTNIDNVVQKDGIRSVRRSRLLQWDLTPEGIITSTIERSHGEDIKNHVFRPLF